MLAVSSGKYGYMRLGGIEQPIYSWSLNEEQKRPTYRTSNSQNYPKRTQGLFSSRLSISGVATASPLLLTNYYNLEVGYIKFNMSTRKEIAFRGMVMDNTIEFDYTNKTSPDFKWTSNLIGIDFQPTIATVPLVPLVDPVLGGLPLCNKDIKSTDPALMSGDIDYVLRAKIMETSERSEYYRSNSNNFVVTNEGTYDRTVELEIEGGFDYWLVRMGDDTIFDYYFYYGSGGADYWFAEKMKVLNVSNFVVNIETGEMIRATVTLGASYG